MSASTRRGFFYEDAERIVQVVALKKGQLGVALKHKSDSGQLVRFAISLKGAKLLDKFLRGVMAGKGTRIQDKLPQQSYPVAVWIQVENTPTPPDAEEPR